MSNRKYVPESIQAYIVPSGDAHQVRRQSDMIDVFLMSSLLSSCNIQENSVI